MGKADGSVLATTTPMCHCRVCVSGKYYLSKNV